MSSSLLTPLFRPAPLFFLAALLRLALLLYGTWQDAHSAVKYTDIDYLVFTDAARSVSRGLSPYARETYRYTPLLAWLLAPTASPRLFSFGKVAFALADLLAGWLIVRVLRKRQRGMSVEQAGAFAAIWLWNPMVATISTRGSSEGLLGVLTMALLWAVEGRRIGLAGFILGLSVHFKIYPFIYAPAIIWWMDDEHLGKKASKPPASFADAVLRFVSTERIKLTLISLSTFMGLNILMYYMYVPPALLPSTPLIPLRLKRPQSSAYEKQPTNMPLPHPATAPPFSSTPTSTTSPALTTATTSPRTTSTSTSPPPTRPPAPSMPSSPSSSSRASSSPLSSPRRISPRP